MTYHKLLVDNPNCMRRFHLSYDDEAQPLEKVEVTCPFCEAVVFERTNHPPLKRIREENLTKTTELSPYRARHCAMYKPTIAEEPTP